MLSKRQLLLALFTGAAIFALTFFPGDLNLSYLKDHSQALETYAQNHPNYAAFQFFLAYFFATALSLPVASLLGLAAGMIFGLVKGVLLVSFASSLGATAAFLIARYFGRDFIQNRYGEKLKAVNDAFHRDGLFYLFALRLTPSFPFFLINILMGLTGMSVAGFYLTSQISMLPGTLVYVNAGTQLQGLDSIESLFSPQLLGAFFLLGILPILSRWAIRVFSFLRQNSPSNDTNARGRPE